MAKKMSIALVLACNTYILRMTINDKHLGKAFLGSKWTSTEVIVNKITFPKSQRFLPYFRAL